MVNTCCQIFRQGLARGAKKNKSHLVPLGALVTARNNVLGAGWGSYFKHHGGSHDRDTVERQMSTTTRRTVRDLIAARNEITSFNQILARLEKVTGLKAFLIDILQQSSTGERGSKESMFTSHIDNNEEGTDSILMAVILMNESSSSMRILGKEEFFYTLPGETAVFPSALFHETITALPGTMKLSILLRYQH